MLAQTPFLQRLEALLGPWTVSGPARSVARLALADRVWQDETRRCLHRDSRRLHAVLTASGLAPSGGTELFQWVLTPHAAVIHGRLARRGLLVRQFASPASLRFGLPAHESEWQRLCSELGTLSPVEAVT
jgi:cobalamin biosynthetic protein CobC